MVLKDLLALVVIFFFQVQLSNNKKEWMKQNQLDDCKVRSFINLGEFEILTKESV